MQLGGARLAVACFVTLVVGGCGGSQPPITSHPNGLSPLGEGSAVLTSGALDLVTESGRWPSTEETLNAAIDKLVAQCMQAKHLKYIVVATPVVNNDDEAQIV